MQSFHEWLNIELEQRQSRINDPCPIETEVEESGTVLGVIPDDLKSLFFLMHDLVTEHDATQNELLEWRMSHLGFNPEHPEDAKPELIGEFQERKLAHAVVSDKLKTVKTFFWTSVHHIFPDSHNYNSISLCKDWQIVGTNEMPELKIEVFGFGGLPGFEAPTLDRSFLDIIRGLGRQS